MSSYDNHCLINLWNYVKKQFLHIFTFLPENSVSGSNFLCCKQGIISSTFFHQVHDYSSPTAHLIFKLKNLSFNFLKAECLPMLVILVVVLYNSTHHSLFLFEIELLELLALFSVWVKHTQWHNDAFYFVLSPNNFQHLSCLSENC